MTGTEKTSDLAGSSVTVKARQALPLWSRDPWLFRGAIAGVSGCPAAGEVVEVRDEAGRWIGRGHWSPESRIAVRLFSWDADEAVGPEMWRARLDAALELRHERLGLGVDTDAYRIVHGEGDGIPGLVLDRIGEALVCQAGSAGALALRELVAEWARERLPGTQLCERHDPAALSREGVGEWQPLGGLEAVPEVVMVREAGVAMAASPGHGQKTGFYADQRDNRIRIGALARGRRLADLFTHAGGFALHAAAAGATEVVAVDTSASALECARRGVEAGGHAERIELIEADAVEWAITRAREGVRFDIVVVDPPKLVHSRGGLKRGLARYRRIFDAALRLVAPRGQLALFSCSGLVARDELERAVVAVLRDGRRTASVLARLHAGSDHPFRPRAGGGEYLEGLLLGLLD